MKEPRRIQAVIFDYDGILNDSLGIITELFNEFHKAGLTKTFFRDVAEFSNFYKEDYLENLQNAGMELTEENMNKAFTIAKAQIPLLDKKAELFPGADTLLLRLKQDGYKTGIVSNGYKEAIQTKLKEHNLESCIDTVIGCEEVNKKKPDPEGIIKCLEELGIDPEEALYVGDQESDIQASKNACVKVIAATYGYLSFVKNKVERLKGADAYADNVSEIYECIKQISE